jgi:hypothetical protein
LLLLSVTEIILSVTNEEDSADDGSCIDLARYMTEVIEAGPDMELLATGPLTAGSLRTEDFRCAG